METLAISAFIAGLLAGFAGVFLVILGTLLLYWTDGTPHGVRV